MPTNESRRPTVLTRRKRRKEERQRPSLNECALHEGAYTKAKPHRMRKKSIARTLSCKFRKTMSKLTVEKER